MNTRSGFPPPDEGPGPPARAADLPPPAERGATVIPDRVVARIAAQAARTAQSRRAALPTDPSGPAAPAVSATTRTGSVRLHLAVDLPYPTDIPHVSERLRHDVAERVTQLTGLRVREVTLTVRRLLTAADANRGRVR
ncbi:Asp23/Gls24 family envelope stress response protein [Streptomyces sp. NPDC059894]|uniref:Asp23/Gls24 family envelope stress response protein n=1 Tax=unclassified Streptomyces TaxID=2593676 RepID=UPI00364EDE06